VGCLLPVKASKRLGRFATLTFPQSPLFRLNTKLWIAAILLGMLADLPRGFVGELTNGSINFLTGIVAPHPRPTVMLFRRRSLRDALVAAAGTARLGAGPG
jgi:hypothetical protein